MKEKKILYFEGAGWSGANGEYNGLNCRIRTAFTNNQGKKIYLEILGAKKHKHSPKEYPDIYGHIDFCHYITDDPNIDDCNNSPVKYKKERVERNGIVFEYTLEKILLFINKYCHCKFDEVVILPDYAGYQVFGDFTKETYGTYKMYNYGDQFIYDEELTARITAKVDELKKYFSELFNVKYDNTSYWREGNNLRYRINTYQEKVDAAGIKDRNGIICFD